MADKPKLWFKVLVDGKSCHGGTHEWSLPRGKTPGKWHRIPGKPVLCVRGFHVTDDPAMWFDRARVIARGDCLVDAYGQATVIVRSRKARIYLNDDATKVPYRKATPGAGSRREVRRDTSR